ncbi:DNA repair protein MmcB-related protein [Erythrobacteraceae bacterium CFH 75059]|uniref:MmcB family DNA repair protein n=1 Tax=Qipengyuania thermophila TaxID=2509361 RepID=UPI00101F8FC5|nr:MmcB family DNA repair protein [Qipengyuania thermophila]TCD06647.1 DNA repair protein MmcB-related protein [Erythrobacteraceae bacterium CFH 75059]
MLETPRSSATVSSDESHRRDLPEGGAGAVDALRVARGIARLFARNGIWCLPEMPLRNGRRADLMGIDPKGCVIIVEIKVSRADLLGDCKWADYLAYCDRFYWGLPPTLCRGPLDDAAFLPERCGTIVSDGYDAEIVRPAASVPLAPARRRKEVERLARTAMRRLCFAADPSCAEHGETG